ncbi:DNA-binding protein [Luteimonas sp. R10]|uniref:DNA-binding protein n=1 Tax=Luteimonas sp. R10 TaxID=3108176 RepID=UPI00308FB3DA|nr:DNA-binding protein [Luteimonas sp. R10]
MAVQLDFQTFIEGLRAPGMPLIAPDRFAEALHLRQQELAQLARVHRTTVADAPANARLQQYMRDALRVLSAASETGGERAHAIDWYRNAPIPEFEHRTAEQLVSAGKADAVISYLLSTGGGSTG